jgi:D-arabinitol dehydrogenase (NADP+)
VKAVVYDRPRNFTVTDIPTPEPQPGEVLVRVLQTGVCGTDLHLHDGQFLAAFPLVPGHEVVGTVARLGDGVESVQVGEQVTVNPNSSCGRCEFCRAGRPILCPELTGMGSNRPGAFAEYVVAPARQVFSVEGMAPDTAVFVEPASCVMHGVDTIAPRPGSTALVLGAGPTGLLLAQLIRSSGAVHVTVAAPTAFKLERASALGIDATMQMDRADLAGDVEKLRALSGGAGYDLVVDATGDAKVCAVCLPLTRNGGTAVFYGVTDEDDLVPVSPYDIFRRELTVKGSFAEIDSFPAAIAALRTGRARTDGIITHRFALDDYGKALDALRDDASAHKIVIIP